MFDFVTALSTNLFRILIIKRFMKVFFETDVEEKWKERALYSLFYFVILLVYLLFHFPPANIGVNILMIYLITQIYESDQKKKILVTLLIYSINMVCDILCVYSFSNYIVGGGYNEVSTYATVFLFSICEFIIERYVMRNKAAGVTPPYWNILLLIPAVSIILLLVLVMNNLNNRPVLITVSVGILAVNLLIFYLYNALMDICLKLQENALFERQIAGYENQLEVLMQSEEKIRALQHDMKHHLKELLSMADLHDVSDISDYIRNMQMFMTNPKEYTYSGNKEIDSVLNYMLHKAEQTLYKVECKINVPKELDIRTFDLNVIFGNLLDNAIEAAGHSEEKWLSVLASFEKGILFIEVKNSFSNRVIRKGDGFVTTKEETKGHGIGLQNVKRIVNGYDGTMEVTSENHIFDVKIMLYTLSMKE